MKWLLGEKCREQEKDRRTRLDCRSGAEVGRTKESISSSTFKADFLQVLPVVCA